MGKVVDVHPLRVCIPTPFVQDKVGAARVPSMPRRQKGVEHQLVVDTHGCKDDSAEAGWGMFWESGDRLQPGNTIRSSVE